MLVCQWGVPLLDTNKILRGPYNWAPQISTSFRLTDDISYGTVTWQNILRIYNQALHLNVDGRPTASIPDLDLLEVGNQGLSFDEQKTHFAIWTTFKSALMISTDPTNMSPQTISILANKGLIAINQDSLGAPVKLVQRFTNDYDILVGPLANGDQVVLVVDHSNTRRTLNLALSSIGITSASVLDVWTNTSLGKLSTVSQTVAVHGSMVLRLSDITAVASSNVKYSYFEAEFGTLSGASVRTCPSCSNGKIVGNIVQGSRNTLTISNIYTSKSTPDVLFDYINADVQYLGSSTGSNRAATISVNGGAGTTVLFPFSGYDWDGDASIFKNFKVNLAGFKTNGPNTIAISAVTIGNTVTDAPDFDRIAIQQ